MAQRTNPKSTKNSSTAKNPPNKPNDGLDGKQRRARNLKLREDAQAKAKAAGLPWDETIRAAEFFDDFDKAYAAATTSPNAKPIEDAPTVVVTPKTEAQETTAELLKKAKEVLLPSDETRNGEPPTEAVTEEAVAEETTGHKPLSKKERKALKYAEKQAKRAEKKPAEATTPTTPTEPVKADNKVVMGTSAGEAVVYDSTNDKPVEHALVDEQPEEQHVDESLVEHGSFAATDAAEQQEGTDEPSPEVVTEQPVEAPADEAEQPVEQADAPTEVPAEPEQVVEPVSTPATETTEQSEPKADEPAKPEANVAVTAPKADKKPTLTIVSDNPNDPKLAAAKEFYGDACTPSRAKLLAEALMWLNKAIVFEKAGEKTKTEMAFKAALKKEAEAFASEMALAA